MSNNQTKHVSKQPIPKKTKAPYIAAAAVVGSAAAVYIALCAAGSSGNSFRRNTSINGISVEKMTMAEAEETLQKAFDGVFELDGSSYAALSVTPDIPSYTESFDLDVREALVWDFTDTVREAYQAQRGGSFFLQGAKLLKGGAACKVLPYVEAGQALDEAIEASGILQVDTSVDGLCQVGEDRLTVTKGKDGFVVDEKALIEAITAQTAEGSFAPILCKAAEKPGLGVDLQSVYDEIHQEMTEPTIKVAADRSYEIVEAVTGIAFDVAEAEQTVKAAADGSSFEIPLTISRPKMTTEEFKECLFRDQLGGYSTYVSGSAARVSNVRLAAKSCNGYILMPGEEFDYNSVVGQRTAAAGYQAAPAYQNGETVNELGGGVCQVSSTLYCACLYANLKITTRRNHTYVSSYVPMGMDATVSWGGPDFRFVNDTDYPIMLTSSYDSGKLHFGIMGTDVNHYNVEITSQTLAVIDAPVKKVEDPSLYEGETAVKSSGHTGYKVQTYRHVYDADGKLVWEGEEAYSHYSTSDRIILVGTKKKPEEPKPEEPKPEEPSAPETPAETQPEATTDGE